MRNPVFRFQNDRKTGFDEASKSSFPLRLGGSKGSFEYIFLQIRLDFHVCSVKWGINLSQTKNRSTEKTLFLSACYVKGFLMSAENRPESVEKRC
ncbi:hypothetical protein HMPREF9442_00676 [Paraprevotella xylaniphila YIT 11841]|uniref:Uncharacterized protein n=1 Tax=Paraprevotella xylaniphila YIT 11841 TaxID=762982 RepID=F3QR77_9BACT|nr:hypothetical protein HMPREF9442_00676 [Paraprevotella xylaniphila YIT 11841]